MAGQYQDQQDSKIYGSRLIIHRRVDLDNNNFYFRAKVSGHTGYIRRSCQTDDPARAMLLAEQAYEELLVRAKGGFALKTVTVDAFFDGWIEATKHRLTETRYKWKKSVYARYVSGYFDKKNISDLTKKDADGYWHYRLNFWNSDAGQKRIANNKERAGAKTLSSHNVAKMPSFTTLKSEASLINEMLRAAEDEGHLQRSIKISPQDAIAKSERTDGYRDTFTDDEWRILTVNLYNYAHCRGQYAGKRVNAYHQLQRRMLHAFVLLALSTGMRVGELRKLRWSDLDKRLIQDSRYGQTNSICQGSILMDLIAEIALGYVDSLITEELIGQADFKILRYCDDYRIFANSDQRCEQILKIVSDKLRAVGMRLGVAKTTSSNNVIEGSIKEDKLSGIGLQDLGETNAKTIQKQLLRLHTFGRKFPNSGALRRLVGDMHVKIANKPQRLDDLKVQIAIAADIAVVSPSTFPAIAATLSHLISCAAVEEKEKLWELIQKKMSRVPYNGYLEIWLQRVTNPLSLEFDSNEEICKVVNQMPAKLWENSWVTSKALLEALEVTQVLVKAAKDKTETVSPKEIELFTKNAWSY